jgi:uncharacterized protein (DUF58 family)
VTSILPTRRLAAVAAVAAVVLLVAPLGSPPVVATVAVVVGLLVLVAVGDALAGVPPGRLTLERRHPPVLVVGDAGTLTWSVHNGSGRSAVVHVADDLAPSLGARTRRFHARVPGGDTARITTTIRPSRRGRFAPDRLTLRIEGPLGLGARQRSVPVASVLRVNPPFRSADEAELKIRRGRILEVGMRSARGLGGGTEFEQLREYAPDDEFRRIDWTATARSGKPIVRTYRAERNQSVVVLLDNGRVMAGRVDGVPRVEHAMDAAMMLAAVATGLGDKCGLVAFDRRVRSVVPPARRGDQLGRITEAMYALEPELAESDYSGAFAETVARFRRRAMLVLLTDLNEQAVTDAVLPALPLVVRTHLVVIGAVRDPEVQAWSTATPTDDESAYRRVAAVAALAERERTAARLRGVGATVIDAAPGRLAGELAAAYLMVKSAGRL